MVGGIGMGGVTPPQSAERDRRNDELLRGAERKGDKDVRNEVKDRVTIGESSEESKEVTYGKPLDREQILDSKFLMLRELVAKTFKEQGISTTIDVGEGKTVNLEDLTPDEAAKLVADDGYWGVEQTSDRIVEFATSLAGGDVALLEKIKEGVVKGFEMAKKDFGMELPEISQKTFEAVMRKLDEWSQQAGAESGGKEAVT
ncbi:hypothetical protein KIP69_05270 [Geobacter sulfurreducens]|jgi:hypothetical protein|uniref:Hydrogenase-4 component G n=1 Tax=Geobacter sulfurreducens (strain ATCC 51573 / DSM 12127 / PCA) TaxID=243231 RepID=Q74ED7_GEOSL|nr:hypothetical protein [Geobacter sulfurreducens]AAR34352.1 hypothetical protein GSU1025 [Geobacter sulfurreducens PCA]AJY70752.1 hypothetical protein RW64_14765 [Geobacter sulfurreducens]QVW36263.1 hypothetical protein KIP69_05270 [Geobacter sulfurreducens]UAC05074.1 hypothetical protein KVP06_05150 [Geobacter sulfurreducens]HBB69101.1 hypothetical protein [Geobacter sulfurreducens]